MAKRKGSRRKIDYGQTTYQRDMADTELGIDQSIGGGDRVQRVSKRGTHFGKTGLDKIAQRPLVGVRRLPRLRKMEEFRLHDSHPLDYGEWEVRALQFSHDQVWKDDSLKQIESSFQWDDTTTLQCPASPDAEQYPAPPAAGGPIQLWGPVESTTVHNTLDHPIRIAFDRMATQDAVPFEEGTGHYVPAGGAAVFPRRWYSFVSVVILETGVMPTGEGVHLSFFAADIQPTSHFYSTIKDLKIGYADPREP